MITVIGFLLMITGGFFNAKLSWDYPDMTTRRLWLEFGQQISIYCLAIIIGAGLFTFGLSRKI